MKDEDTSDWWWPWHSILGANTTAFCEAILHGMEILLRYGRSPKCHIPDGEAISLSYASTVVKNVWTTASNIGYSEYFIFEQGGSNLPTITCLSTRF